MGEIFGRIVNTIYEFTAEYGLWKKKFVCGKILDWVCSFRKMQKIASWQQI